MLRDGTGNNIRRIQRRGKGEGRKDGKGYERKG